MYSASNGKPSKEATNTMGEKSLYIAQQIGILSKIYEELQKNIKTNKPVKKKTKEMNRQFSREQTKMGDRHMKKCSITLATREIQ